MNVFQRLILIVSSTLLTALASLSICAYFGLKIITTDSLPRGIYWGYRGTIHTGNIVTFCLPDTLALYAARRRYLSVGPCPHHTIRLAKIVAATAGDRVIISHRGVLINGKMWPLSAPQRVDSNGRTMHWKEAEYVVATGDIFVMGMHPASWDSRYYGDIPITLVDQPIYPVLIQAGIYTNMMLQQIQHAFFSPLVI